MSKMKQKLIDQIEAEGQMIDEQYEFPPDDIMLLTDNQIDMMFEDKEFVVENTCTCGTYKAMGAIDPNYHTDWCDIHDNVND